MTTRHGDLSLGVAGALGAAHIADIAVRAEAAGVEITPQEDAVEVFGWGDPERFSQALDHLIQTAVKLSHEGGRIHVRASQTAQGWAEIAVRDEGDGFTNDGLVEALEAFKELHRGLDRSFSGPGVGYAVAKTFVEMQGGRFSIESREGQGTLARISLPPAEAVYGDPQEDEDGAEAVAERDHDAA